MKIRLRNPISCAHGNWPEGAEVSDREIPDAMITALLNGGYAEPIKRTAERAVLEPKDNTDGWPLKMSPRRYLGRHPHGPNADLARQILAE